MRTTTGRTLPVIAQLLACLISTGLASAQPVPVDREAMSAAQDDLFKDLLPDLRDGKICFARRYDAAHLRRHPEQQVKSLLLQIRRDRDDGGPFYGFRLSADVRGRKNPFYTYGECKFYDRWFRCGVECDGGGFLMERNARTGDLLVRIDDRLRMHDCDADENGVDLTPGTDDKVFRLQGVRAVACASLDKRVD